MFTWKVRRFFSLMFDCPTFVLAPVKNRDDLLKKKGYNIKNMFKIQGVPRNMTVGE